MKTKETSKSKRRIVLLDTHAIIHRAYHALPDFSTSSGRPTGALYGLASMIISIVKDLNPDYVIACYDLPGGTFRTTMYTGYKAHRKELDGALSDQIEGSREVLSALSIPLYEVKGFEADDLLGTISEKLKKDKENEIIIASGDMDTLQLVDGKNVKVFTLKRGLTDTVIYDEKAVVERFGFKPELLPDYKGLRGDPSDNIIGIPGIGEKTATTLITNFGSLEQIFKKLKKGDEAFREVSITPRIIELLRNGEEEAMFSKTLATIRRDAPIEFDLPEKNWKESVVISRAEKLFGELEFRSLGARLRAVLGEAEAASATPEPENEVNVDPALLKRLTVALSLLDSEKSDPDIEDVLSYARTRDPKVAEDYIMKALERNGLMRVWTEIEEPIIPIVAGMTKCGIKIDKEYFQKLSKKYHGVLATLEQEIYKLSGEEFNIKSPKQLGEVLFVKLGLPTAGVKKSASGGYSTQIEVLEKLEESHPIIGKIMEFRELQKLLSTYIDVLPEFADSENRVHPEYLQIGAATGRFSSKNPSIQNIPTKTELGRNIRGGFVAEKGWKLVSFDYSQIEFRLAAIFAKDEYLINSFNKGDDAHTAVASKVFGVPLAEVTKEMRRRAKVINFGILYGMGVNALRKNLGGTQKEAAAFYSDYFEKFKSIESYLESTKEFAKKYGYTETLFGRKRYFPNINSSVPFIQKMAERMAVNAPLQGTVADIMKISMRFISERLQREGLAESAFPLLQIHDELIFEIKDSDIERVSEIVTDEMQGVFKKSYINFDSPVPLVVNSSSGQTWQDL